jgi:hypothetical protein
VKSVKMHCRDFHRFRLLSQNVRARIGKHRTGRQNCKPTCGMRSEWLDTHQSQHRRREAACCWRPKQKAIIGIDLGSETGVEEHAQQRARDENASRPPRADCGGAERVAICYRVRVGPPLCDGPPGQIPAGTTSSSRRHCCRHSQARRCASCSNTATRVTLEFGAGRLSF